MPYTVKEIFYTLQGEGANTGKAAVFCRFSGCNLWTGREQDRRHAVCPFCDTDFLGIGPDGGRFATADMLVDSVSKVWKGEGGRSRFVVCTVGEPLLQVDDQLIEAFHRAGFKVAIETNGTLKAPPSIDWICVRPKAGFLFKQKTAYEIKLVYPQQGAMPERFEHMSFENFFLQPMDGNLVEENTRLAIDYCMSNPQWRLSLQTHKMLGL